MHVLILSPAARGSRAGNAVTAERYARMLRGLGHRVRIAKTYEPSQHVDLLIALHARRSGGDALRYRRRNPDSPLVVVLTGTDLYRDLAHSRIAERALETADAIVTLQAKARERVPRALRSRVVPIVQSSPLRLKATRSPSKPLRVCVLGHLRYEKDPMRAALALRELPRDFPIEVVQAGGILQDRFIRATQDEMQRDSRYKFVGEVSQPKAHALLRRSDLLVISSRMEGGANVVSEAIACGTPVIASRVDGNVGLLGAKYPGLYKLGDARALARLLERAANDRTFYERLRKECTKLRPLVAPEREQSSWRHLLRKIV